MMSKLELKIPPLVQILIFGSLMWLIDFITPSIPTSSMIVGLASTFILIAGCVFALKGVLDFRADKTTVDPTNPNKSSSLVDHGIYSYSRNPMYVGFFLWLIAWGLFLSNGFALLIAFLFPIYMTKFQIVPEERTLEEIFDQDYIDYKGKVRRWI